MTFWAVYSPASSAAVCNIVIYLNDNILSYDGYGSMDVESSYAQLSIQIGTFNNPTSVVFGVGGGYCIAENIFLDDFAIIVS